jgi:zinc and cadmium transporter
LLPELQFHSHDRLKLSISLMAGIGLAALIGVFETSGHERGGDQPDKTPAVEPAKITPAR